MESSKLDRQPRYIKRESGIELLKIVAILFIVINHVCQTLGEKPLELIQLASELIDASMATTNIQYIIIAFFRHFGSLGNNIFLACSFWFLCDSKKFKINKIVTILMDVWLISVIYLVVYLAIGESISARLFIQCVFPSLFANNWFITCYLLIYLIHPYLNIIIAHIDQKTHAVMCLISLALYSGVVYLQRSLLFTSALINFIVMFFVISYIKKYMRKWSNCIKYNIMLLIFGLVGVIGMLLLTNMLGLQISFLSNKVLMWNGNNNPFIIATAIALLNIFRQIKFKSYFVNYWASLALIIYVVHENILFRNFTRVRIWVDILECYGYDYILVQVMAYAIILFIVASIVSTIYQYTIHRFVLKIEPAVEKILVGGVGYIADCLIKIN